MQSLTGRAGGCGSRTGRWGTARIRGELTFDGEELLAGNPEIME